MRLFEVLVMARTHSTATERILWRRLRLCRRVRRGGAALIVLAGLLALLVFPVVSHHASFATTWTPRAVAVLGWLVVFFSMYFDQLYRGEYLARKEGEHLRQEVRWASIEVVLAAALPVFVIFVSGPNAGGLG